MNLVILTENDRNDEQTFTLRDYRAEHIRTVLKLTPGDTVSVGLLNGPHGIAQVEQVTVESVVLRCDDWRNIASSRPEIDLICALPRPQTVKKVLITCGMMGVRSLHLVRANRVEKSYFQSPLIEPEHQLPYLIEGLSQGKSTRLPIVRIHNRFRRFFEDDIRQLADNARTPSLRLLCNPDTDVTMDSVFSGHPESVTIAVGPEGGWVPFETELMRGIGFQPFTLGRWTLRVEHAVVAGLAQIELLRAKEALPRRTN